MTFSNHTLNIYHDDLLNLRSFSAFYRNLNFLFINAIHYVCDSFEEEHLVVGWVKGVLWTIESEVVLSDVVLDCDLEEDCPLFFICVAERVTYGNCLVFYCTVVAHDVFELALGPVGVISQFLLGKAAPFIEYLLPKLPNCSILLCAPAYLAECYRVRTECTYVLFNLFLTSFVYH